MTKCKLQKKPVSEDMNAQCSRCTEYLTSCMPVIIDGYLYGECDESYCSNCAYNGECGQV